MTLVKNPMLSIDAKGLFGGFTLFSHHYKISCANLYLLKKDKRTNPQLVYRAEWGICVSRWRCANDSAKAYYQELGKVFALQGGHYHMKEYFDLIKNNYCGYAICNVCRCGA